MSIIKHVTLQKIVAHDFRYDPHRKCTQSQEIPLKVMSEISAITYSTTNTAECLHSIIVIKRLFCVLTYNHVTRHTHTHTNTHTHTHIYIYIYVWLKNFMVFQKKVHP